MKRMEIEWSEGDIWDLMKENNGNGRGYMYVQKYWFGCWLAGWQVSFI
jgi:hypothetical protein